MADDITKEEELEITRKEIALLKEKKRIEGDLSAAEQVRLTALQRSLDVLTSTVDAAKTYVETLKHELDLLNQSSQQEESRYLKKIRDIEAGNKKLKIVEAELDFLRKMAKAGKKMEPDEQKRLETLEKMESTIERSHQAQQENNDLLKGSASLLENRIQKSYLRIADISNRGLGDMGKALGNLASGLGDQVFGRLISEVKSLIFEFDNLTKGFERQFQMGEEYTQSIEAQYKELNNYGVSIEEAVEAQSQLIVSFTDFTMVAKEQRDMLTETSAILGELGISQADFAKGAQHSTKFFGQSVEQADSTARELLVTARELGVAPEAMAAQFAAAGSSFAKFGQDGVKAFKDLSRIQKLTGMEMEKVLAITNRFDTFEGAAEQAGKLNAALGGNFVNAMDLMTATDPAERFGMIRDSILDAGLTFDDMSYYQKQFYTESLGLSDVGDLALMLSGNMDSLAGSTEKSAEELIKEKERALEVQSAQEKLQITMAQLTETFLPLVGWLQKAATWMAENTGKVKAFIVVLGLWKAVSIALSIKEAIRLARLPMQAAGTATLTAATEAQAVATAQLATAVSTLAAAEGGSVAPKTASTVATVQSGTAAAAATGPFAAFALAALQVGAAALMVGVGIGIMAAAFSLLNLEQLIGLPITLLALGAALYFAGPALASFGALGTLAVPILLSLAAVVLSVGVAAMLVGKGIQFAALGFVAIFEAIDLEKAAAMGIFMLSMAGAAFILQFAGAGMLVLAGGLFAVGLALKFIATRDLEAMASFATGLAELNLSNIAALSTALRGVASAMEDIPEEKALALTATMKATGVAAAAASQLAGTTPPAAVAIAAARRGEGGTQRPQQNQQPIDVHVTLELDGEELDRRIVRVNRNSRASGGALSSIGQLLG